MCCWTTIRTTSCAVVAELLSTFDLLNETLSGQQTRLAIIISEKKLHVPRQIIFITAFARNVSLSTGFSAQIVHHNDHT